MLSGIITFFIKRGFNEVATDQKLNTLPLMHAFGVMGGTVYVIIILIVALRTLSWSIFLFIFIGLKV